MVRHAVHGAVSLLSLALPRLAIVQAGLCRRLAGRNGERQRVPTVSFWAFVRHAGYLSQQIIEGRSG